MYKFNKWLLVGLLIPLVVIRLPTEASFEQDSLSLPIGQNTLKITIVGDGIYTITGADIEAAGLPLNQLPPQTLTMMHRGQPIATHFIGNNDALFEADEAIQFYGWAFDGPRYEKQFIQDNIFWLWSSEPSNKIELLANEVDTNATQNWVTEIMIIAPENDFFSGWTDQWHTFPNEPDAWYWDRIPRAGSGVDEAELKYDIDLSDPRLNGADVILTTEWMSRAKSSTPGSLTHEVTVSMNNSPTESLVWNGRKNVNLIQTVPATALSPNNNQLSVIITTPDVLYLNQAIVTYSRQLILDNRIRFTHETAKDLLIDVGETAIDDLMLWQVTDPASPKIINIQPEHLNNTDLRIGKTTNEPIDYILQKAQPQKPVAIERYVPVELAPHAQQATWIAISHPTFLPQAERLAAYRETHDGFTTHVINAEHLFNQIGYGFRHPSAINAYLQDTQHNWQEPPQFVTLFGDATINPRQLDCQWSCQNSAWDTEEPTFLPTDLQFVDRFQGLIPTDQTMGMLDDDLVPDVMIGRIAAQTLAEAEAAVSKIMTYETAVSLQTHTQKDILFLADSTDAAGDFCQQNQNTAQRISSSQSTQSYCLPVDANQNDVINIHQALFQQINGQGSYLLNYRGHGSIQFWGGGDGILLSVADNHSTLGAWLNHIPTVIISADCLDGHFAWPGLPAISETLLTMPISGTAAHWSSSGLGGR